MGIYKNKGLGLLRAQQNERNNRVHMKTRHRLQIVSGCTDCNVVHPEAICSPHGLQIAFS